MKSKRTERFISHKISLLRHEGYPEKQSVAIAFSMARKRGFHVTKRVKR